MPNCSEQGRRKYAFIVFICVADFTTVDGIAILKPVLIFQKTHMPFLWYI